MPPDSRDPASGATSPENREIVPARLFAPPARWGYERIDPSPPAEPGPELRAAPEPVPVGMIPRPQATGLRAASVLATVGAVVVLTLDSGLRAFTLAGAHGAAKTIVFALVSLLAAGVAYRFTFIWNHGSADWRAARAGHPVAHPSDPLSRAAAVLRDPRRALEAIPRNAGPSASAVVCFFLPSLVLTAQAVIGWVRVWQTHEYLVPDPREERRTQERHDAATDAWRKRVERFEAAEHSRVRSAEVWYPVLLSHTTPTTLVFGGTRESWRAVLTTVGGSLLAERRSVLICDLSLRPTATEQLCELARAAGFGLGTAVFPRVEPVLRDLRSPDPEATRLTVLGIDRHAGEVAGARSARLLCERLLRELDRGAHADVLIVLGAERVADEQLRMLLDRTTPRHALAVDASTAGAATALGASPGPATLVFFERFRSATIERAGAAGAAVALLRLAAPEEAADASLFIGASHRFVATGHTHAIGSSQTHTEGTENTTSASAAFGLPHALSAELSTSHSHSRSEAVGRSDEHATTFQRVREPHHEPEALMRLPSTGMIYVETTPSGRRLIVELDCDPTLTSEAKIAGPHTPGAQA